MSKSTLTSEPKCDRCQTPMERYAVPGTGGKEQAWRLACPCQHSTTPDVARASKTVTFDALPLGARFRYPGKNDVWVKLENGGCGIVAEWSEPQLNWPGQGIYSFADSEQQRASGQVEWIDRSSDETLQPASNERLSDTNLRNIRSWAENHLEFSSDDSGPRMIAEAMDELLMRRRAAETLPVEAPKRLPRQTKGGWVCPECGGLNSRGSTLCQVCPYMIPRTASQAPAWNCQCGEPSCAYCGQHHSEKAKVVPSICGKPMPDGKGAGQCINPPGHEGDCDDMPF